MLVISRADLHVVSLLLHKNEVGDEIILSLLTDGMIEHGL